MSLETESEKPIKEVDAKVESEGAEKGGLNFTDIMMKDGDKAMPGIMTDRNCLPGRAKLPTCGFNTENADAKKVAKCLEENKDLDRVDDTFEKYADKGRIDQFEEKVNAQLAKDGSNLEVNVSDATDINRYRKSTFYNLALMENGRKIDEDGFKDTHFKIFHPIRPMPPWRR